MKRKVISLALFCIVVLVMFIPGTLAFMFSKTQTIVNNFTPAHVSCKVNEKDFAGATKSEVSVTNTSNIAAYIRVCVAIRWEDAGGNPMAWDAPEVTIPLADGWIQIGDIYYYQYVVPAGTTVAFFEKDKSISLEYTELGVTQGGSTEVFEYYPVIDIIAEAIQSVPDSAVEGNWPVTIQDNVERTLVASSS